MAEDNSTTEISNSSSTVNSVVNVDLKGMSAVGRVLVEKVAEGIAGIARPFQLVRMAKAQAQADLIGAESQMAIDALQERAASRWLAEETKKQQVIEEITARAAAQLSDEAKPQDVDPDWIANLFEKSKNVTDEDMQALWANILAGEAETPKSFSKRTVNLVADLDKDDARLFESLCGMTLLLNGEVPMVFSSQDPIFERAGLGFSALKHLETLGLVHFDSVSGFRIQGVQRHFRAYYRGFSLEFKHQSLEAEPEGRSDLQVGQVLFTRAGMELAKICPHTVSIGFLNYVTAKFQEHGWTVITKRPAYQTARLPR